MSESLVKKSLLICQPKQYPKNLINTLIQSLLVHPKITEAYFAITLESTINSDPKIIIGIKAFDFENDIKNLFKLCNEIGLNYEDLRFVDVNLQPFKSYFNKIKPFYTKEKF